MWNSRHHDSSTKAVFLCTADKLQCCHMLASCTQHTQPSPTFIQHSFEHWVHLSFQVVSFENSHWAGLGRILRHCLHNRRKTTFSYFRGKAFLGKPARCLCHGNEHRGTDPNTSNSGHHDSSRNAAFLCTADEMQCYVHNGYMLGLGRVGIQPSPPFILWDNSFSCSIQWNLGALLAQPQKTVQCLPLPVSAGRLS